MPRQNYDNYSKDELIAEIIELKKTEKIWFGLGQ